MNNKLRLCSLIGLLILCFAPHEIFAQIVFQANDDNAHTGPFQTVKVDVLHNDNIICGDKATWRIISTLDALDEGVATEEGHQIVFTPGPNAINKDVYIQYSLTCSRTDTATLKVTIGSSNLPGNVIPFITGCTELMTGTVAFMPQEKFHTSENIRLDGFSMPLVGDVNGDGKPELVALGLGPNTASYTDGEGLAARAWYVHIFDGQTGARLWSVNMGTEGTGTGKLSNVTSLGHPGITSAHSEPNDQFQLRFNPTHNSPGHLAMADMDNDGKTEIVVAEIGNKSRLYALKPVLDAHKNIVGFTKMWESSNESGRTDYYKYPLNNANHEVYGAGIPYIADINADGTPEVIIYNKIYDGKTGALVCTLESLGIFWQPYNNTDMRKLLDYAYVGRQLKSPTGDGYSPCIGIADIDGDGILDIIAGSKVYKMKNDASGKPALDRIIYGPQKTTVRIGGVQSTIDHTVYLLDGFTTVADIDMDGKLDVIVINITDVSGDNDSYMVYVWDPLEAPENPGLPNSKTNPNKPKAHMYLYSDDWQGQISYPFVGDINGRLDNYDGTKRMPELCFVTGRLTTNGYSGRNCSRVYPHPLSVGINNTTDFTVDANGCVNNPRFNNNTDFATTNGFVLGWTWHLDPQDPQNTPLGERLKLSWALEIVDRSQMTGITMFDFDNDGAMDLCYKDENSIRVISPSLRNYIPYDLNGGPIRFRKDNIYSYTGYEAPVIADVNMDGSADIITTNYPKNDNFHSYGFLYVWEHAAGSDSWAPCPPVWNQTIYNPLYIRENMTVPAKPHSMLEEYENVNGEKIRPFNGHWIQQPIVKEGEKYIPVVRKPDAVLANMNVTVVSNTQTQVTLKIKNTGSAAINANTPIAFYNGYGPADGHIVGLPIGGGATLIGHTDVGVDIFPGENVIRTYNLTGDYTNRLLWARITDDGVSFPAIGYRECDTSDNIISGSGCLPGGGISIRALPDTVVCGHGGCTTLEVHHVTPWQTPPPYYTFQWYRDNHIIAGATDSTYCATNAGDYTCYVTDGVCRDFTPEQTLTVRFMEAYNDTTSVVTTQQDTIFVINNDYSPLACLPQSITITAQPANGVAVASTDTLFYTANIGFAGIDSMEYSLTPDSLNTAKVYTLVHKPSALKYKACSGATVSMAFATIQGVRYDWYDSAQGGAIVSGGSNTDTLVVTKDNIEDIGVWWVEPTYNGQTFARIRIELEDNITPDLYVSANNTTTTLIGDSVSLKVCVVNQGVVATTAPLYVTLYKDSVTGVPLTTDSILVQINPTDTGYVTLSIPDIKPYLPFTAIVARINDNGHHFPLQTECLDANNYHIMWNPALNRMMKKVATLNGVQDNGVYANPVTVLYSEEIEYEITAVNASQSTGTIIISDTLPAYMNYVANSAQPANVVHISVPASGARPQYDVLTWTFNNVPSLGAQTVSFRATPTSGVCASQPLFVSKAWIMSNNGLNLSTNNTYHQGAGISIVTFSAGLGGSLHNAAPQALDYRSFAQTGILIAPDEEYQFIGWSHNGYYSLRGEYIAPQECIMYYDTLTVYGDVELHANFVPDSLFVDGLISEYVDDALPQPADDNRIYTVGDALFVHTSKVGGIVRVYSLDGVLLRQQTILSEETKTTLPSGIYIVTLNDGVGQKVKITN